MKTFHMGQIVTCLVLAFSAAYACAQSDCAPEPGVPTLAQLDTAIKAARNRGFLWKISKGGHASYLYGTIHVAKFEWTFPGKEVVRALNETDSIALEINPLDEGVMQALQQGIAADTAAPLPQALQERIQRLADLQCVPMALLTPLRAELQIATLAEMIGRKDGLEPSYGIDLQLAVLAQRTHKPLQSLETVATQLDALLNTDSAQRLTDTEEALTELESGRERTTLVKVAKAWSESDYQTISSYKKWCQCVNTKAEKLAMQRLLDDRNPVMARQLDQLHTSGRVFAAVGALHMTGPLSLPRLMAQRGYVVQKVF